MLSTKNSKRALGDVACKNMLLSKPTADRFFGSHFLTLFNCTPVDLKVFNLVGLSMGFYVCYLSHRGLGGESTSKWQWCCLTFLGSLAAAHHVVSVESSPLILHGTFRD